MARSAASEPLQPISPPYPRLAAALILAEVVAPALAHLPQPFSLQVGLQEIILLEGLPLKEADLLLHLAANLRPPQDGLILHWGQNLLLLPRMQRYRQRQRLALISPWQSLWRRLTLRENLALPKTISGDFTVSQVSAAAQELWEQLQLLSWLDRYPQELPPLIYHLALWGRELLKEPDLILGLLPFPEGQLASLADYLWPVVTSYCRNRPAALLLAGYDLSFALAESDRLCRVTPAGWREYPLPGRGRKSLLAFLPLT